MSYLLKGSKDPIALFFVFFLANITFFYFLKTTKEKPIPSYVFLPLSFLFLWSWVGLISSPPLDHFFLGLVRFFLYLQMGWVFYQLSDKKMLQYWAFFVLSIGFLEALILFFSYPSREGYLSGNPNYSSLLIAGGFLALFLFADKKKMPLQKQIFLTLGILLFGVGLVLTNSRSILLGLIPLILLHFQKTPKIRISLLILVGVIIGWAVFDSGKMTSLLRIDLKEIGSSFQEYYVGRLVIWKTGILAMLDKWIWGFGIGNFEAGYNLYHQPDGGVLLYDRSTRFAHNDFLQIGVVSGIPGLLALLWAIKNVFKNRPSFSRMTASFKWGLGFLFLFLFSSFFGFNFYLPFIGLLFCATFGLVLPQFKKPKKTLKLSRYKSMLFFFSVLLGAFSFFMAISEYAMKKDDPVTAAKWMPLRSDAWYGIALADIAGKSGPILNPAVQEKIVTNLKRASTWNPWDGFSYSRLARVYFTFGLKSYEEIEAQFKKALEVKPRHTPFWVQSGFLDMKFNALSDAERKFQKAIELEPNAPFPYYSMALLKRAQGEKEEARTLLKTALERYEMHNERVIRSEYANFLFAVDPSKINNLINQND